MAKSSAEVSLHGYTQLGKQPGEAGNHGTIQNLSITIRETQWDESHNWKTAIKGYKLFRRTGEEGAKVLPYM